MPIDPFKKLLLYWPIILAAIAAAAGVGGANYQINELAAQQKASDACLEDHSQRIARLEEATSLLPEIREDIKELLKRSR